MLDRFERHGELLGNAVAALRDREFWTAFPEVPSGKLSGETARGDGLAASNLSVDLTGNVFVNQSAAFSDFHLTDPAFVAGRFAGAMGRRPVAA